jgi:hypothetical protein
MHGSRFRSAVSTFALLGVLAACSDEAVMVLATEEAAMANAKDSVHELPAATLADKRASFRVIAGKGAGSVTSEGAMPGVAAAALHDAGSWQ